MSDFNEVLDVEEIQEEIQETVDIESSDTVGDDLPVTQDDTEINLPQIIQVDSTIDLSTVETLIIESNQLATQQLARLDTITTFINFMIVSIVVYFCYKFIWSLLSSERF